MGPANTPSPPTSHNQNKPIIHAAEPEHHTKYYYVQYYLHTLYGRGLHMQITPRGTVERSTPLRQRLGQLLQQRRLREVPHPYTMRQRMGRGRVGEQMMGGNPTTTVATLSAGHPLGAGGGGRQMWPPTLPQSMTTTTMTTITAAVGGRHAPHTYGSSHPAGRHSSTSLMLSTAVDGGGTGCLGHGCTRGGGGGGLHCCTSQQVLM